ncbi:MAG: TolC family protein [Alphaproteobacteria bacterium]|nr:MAG: TolC family protein [Alphaproteobacteria bacterium]
MHINKFFLYIFSICAFVPEVRSKQQNVQNDDHIKLKNNKNVENKSIKNPELNSILTGDFSQLKSFVKAAASSSQFKKLLQEKFNNALISNVIKMMVVNPKITSDIRIGKVVFDGEKQSNTGKTSYNSYVDANLAEFNLNKISEMTEASSRIKEQKHELKESLSKFCLEEILEVLIDYIISNKKVKLRERITKSKLHSLNQVKARIEAGSMNNSDLYSAEADLASSKMELYVEQQKENILREKLESLSLDAHVPTSIGKIKPTKSWEQTKLEILSGSHLLQKAKSSKTADIARTFATITNLAPSVTLGLYFRRESTAYTRATAGAKWSGETYLGIRHSIGLNSITQLAEGTYARNAARFKLLEEVRKAILAGKETFLSCEGAKKEFTFRLATLENNERALESKKTLFFNSVDLPSQRKVSIDDLQLQENNVVNACCSTLDALGRAFKSHFKLKHMRGTLLKFIFGKDEI